MSACVCVLTIVMNMARLCVLVFAVDSGNDVLLSYYRVPCVALFSMCINFFLLFKSLLTECTIIMDRNERIAELLFTFGMPHDSESVSMSKVGFWN